MIRITSLAIVLGILAWVICLNSKAYAGCIGGAVGDFCAGIAVPSEPPDERRYLYAPQPPVVVEPAPPAPIVMEHHHNHYGPPVIIERHDDD
jgi:hypothetical protein